MNKTMSQMPKDEYESNSGANTARKRGYGDNAAKVVLAQQMGTHRDRMQDSIISDNDESTVMLPINQGGLKQILKDYAGSTSNARKMAQTYVRYRILILLQYS